MTPARSADEVLQTLKCLHGPEIVPACYTCVATAMESYAAEQVGQEREACAKLAEACHGAGAHTSQQTIIATAIRRRGEG